MNTTTQMTLDDAYDVLYLADRTPCPYGIPDCRYGHAECSYRAGGPCVEEALARVDADARHRAAKREIAMERRALLELETSGPLSLDDR